MVYLSCGKNRLHTIPAAKLLHFLHICKCLHKKSAELCFFCTFSFLRPFKADTIHLCFVLRTSGRSFVVHCAGCHPTFFFVFRRILSAAFLHFPCILFHFPSFFLPKFMQIFPFSLHIPFFCTTFAPSFVSVSFRRSPDGRPTVTRRSTDD